MIVAAVSLVQVQLLLTLDLSQPEVASRSAGCSLELVCSSVFRGLSALRSFGTLGCSLRMEITNDALFEEIWFLPIFGYI